uniref:Uncharacterized protein n=1 Tax=Peronospora matthiolae TaxID=2874970 RepID=A0AAV1TSI2_9STRA
MVGYESDTAASSIYDHPQATPPARDTVRTAPNLFVEREEVPSPLAQRSAIDPALGLLHNKLDEDQAQYLQSVDGRKRQAQCVATTRAHSGYHFTQPSVDERITQASGQSLPTWVTGLKAVTAPH